MVLKSVCIRLEHVQVKIVTSKLNTIKKKLIIA